MVIYKNYQIGLVADVHAASIRDRTNSTCIYIDVGYSINALQEPTPSFDNEKISQKLILLLKML